MNEQPVNDRRTLLLTATVDEIARKGTRGMRVDEVAKRAGVSVALIYHHFGDRSGLLRAALLHIGDRADDYTDAGPATSTGRERLLAMLLGEVQDDEVVRVNSAAWGELRGAAIFDETLRPTLHGLTQRWIDDLADAIRVGQADGTIPHTLGPEATGRNLSALVEGISARWLTGMATTEQARAQLAEAAAALLSAS